MIRIISQRFLLCIAALGDPLLSLGAEPELTVKKDDFSNSEVITMGLASNERNATLFVSCFPESGINVQFAFDGVIFPDDLTDDGMIVSITHKFDTADAAHTGNWHMNMMKYDNAWYSGDKSQFLSEALSAKQLSMRLNKNGDIARFDFSQAVDEVREVRTACESQ